jgi:hypothetical protein
VLGHEVVAHHHEVLCALLAAPVWKMYQNEEESEEDKEEECCGQGVRRRRRSFGRGGSESERITTNKQTCAMIYLVAAITAYVASVTTNTRTPAQKTGSSLFVFEWSITD